MGRGTLWTSSAIPSSRDERKRKQSGMDCRAVKQARYSASRLREQPKSEWAEAYVVWSTWCRSVSGKRKQPRERSMDLDLRLQRAFDRVELVSGTIGNPGDGRMCLM